MDLRVVSAPSARELEDLCDVLCAAVEDGASVGFLLPLEREVARAYWRSIAPPAVLFLAKEAGRIEGTVQLVPAWKPNAAHRAEVVKLLVHPRARRRGVARALMLALEERARALGRTLLVLDTREGDPASALYRSLGYIEAGRIPAYARSTDGTLAACTFFYKELA